MVLLVRLENVLLAVDVEVDVDVDVGMVPTWAFRLVVKSGRLETGGGRLAP